MIRPGIDSLGRPVVCADNHYDAVSTPPKHRGLYGLLTVIVPKDLHAKHVGLSTYTAREHTTTRSSNRSHGQCPISKASHHAQTFGQILIPGQTHLKKNTA
jgi:hypothetical protein